MSPRPVSQDAICPPPPASQVLMKFTRSRTDSVASIATNFPGVPFNTPASRSLASDLVPTPLNLNAVTQTLDAVQELHNETADDYHQPAVPLNTPCHGSPNSYIRATIHSLPTIDEKLEKLPPPVASPTSPTSPTSCASFSPTSSVAGEQASSPHAPSPLRLPPLTAENLLDGVRENTDWHDTIEEDMDRDLTRLANLANDDFQRDPSLTAADHYHRRLLKLLSSANRKYMITELGEAVVSTMAERGSLASVKPTNMVTNYEFQNLRRKVGDMETIFMGLLSRLAKDGDKELDRLSQQFTDLMKGYAQTNGC